jgi:hypothetical protein
MLNAKNAKNAKCSMPTMLNAKNAKYQIPNAKCRMPNAKLVRYRPGYRYVFSDLILSPVHGALPAGALAKAGLDQAF